MYKKDKLFQVLLKYDFVLCRNEADVHSYLEKHFNEFVADVEHAANGANPFLRKRFCSTVLDKLPLIKDFCNKLVEISLINRSGKIKEAFESSYSLFSSMEPYYLHSSPWSDKICEYYRIRLGDFSLKAGEDRISKKAELFHIKDSKRNLIGAYRFSIPGFPCMYLASGLELGWLESGMPKQFSYCKMNIEETGGNSLRFIDISNRPVRILSNIHTRLLNAKDKPDELERIYEFLMNYIITYPLAAACSLKVRDREDRYIEEYAIPQMLLSWIREKDEYDGIRYKSSLNTTLVENLAAVNIALPVKTFRADGLCDRLTSKITVSDISFLDVNAEFIKYEQNLKDIKAFKNYLWNKIIIEEDYWGYIRRLVDICETITVTYDSIINGNILNGPMLHQLNCISDYILTIDENKENIVNMSFGEGKQGNPEIDEKKRKLEIEADIEKFLVLVREVIHKHEVFRFNHEEKLNFEKI